MLANLRQRSGSRLILLIFGQMFLIQRAEDRDLFGARRSLQGDLVCELNAFRVVCPAFAQNSLGEDSCRFDKCGIVQEHQGLQWRV